MCRPLMRAVLRRQCACASILSWLASPPRLSEAQRRRGPLTPGQQSWSCRRGLLPGVSAATGRKPR